MSFILSPIDTVDTISPKDFTENYLKARRPLVIKGLTKDWPAREKWTAEYMKEANDISQSYWCNLMHNNIMISKDNPRVDTIAWIFNMKNRFGWKDKTELSSDKDNPLTINLDVKASKV